MKEPRRRPQKPKKPGRSGPSGKARTSPYDPLKSEAGIAAVAPHYDPHDKENDEEAPDFLLSSTIAQIVGGLPVLQREAIEYCVYDRRSYLNASYLMGVNDTTVKAHLRRGLETVARELEDPLVRSLIGGRLPAQSLFRRAMNDLTEESA